MNSYPAELTTPPLALVGLVGRPDLHVKLRDFLRTQQKPPINSLGISDPASVSRLFAGNPKANSEALPTANFLKADWFAKHRQRRPAVAVLLIDREWVVGDPNGWTKACELMDRVRAATRPRSARMVVAVVQDSGTAAEIPEERALVLRRRADLEPRCLVPVTLGSEEIDASVKRLARVILEQAGQFYAEQIRRVLTKASERTRAAPGLPSYAFSIRAAFKAAAYSEFRQDWTTALKQYQSAYAHCQEAAQECLGPAAAGAGAGGYGAVQRHAEVRAVAEQIHVKQLALLMHQQRVPEVLAQVERHLATFKPLPPGISFGAAAAHWGWLRQQYVVAGELLSERVSPGQLPDRRSVQPAFFFECAASAVGNQRREARAAAAIAARGEGSAPELVPGAFVGQMVLAGQQQQQQAPGAAGRAASDAEFEAFHVAQQTALDHSEQAILLLTRAYEGYKKFMLKKGEAEVQRARRATCRLASQMATEYLAAADPATARKLLDGVAAVYRNEQWKALLASVLYMLRDAATKLALVGAHAEYSLELAALPATVVEPTQAMVIAETAVAAIRAAPEGPEQNGMELSVTPGSGMASVLQFVAGFCRQDLSTGARDAAAATFAVALWNSLPIPLVVDKAEVVLHDAAGGSRALAVTWEESVERPGDGPCAAAVMAPSSWCRCWVSADFPAGTLVKAQAFSLQLGGATVLWDLAAAPKDAAFAAITPARDAMLGSITEPFCTSRGSKGLPPVEPGTYKICIGQVSIVPELALCAPPGCLVGERLPLRCTVSTSGAPLEGASLLFDVQSNGVDDNQCPDVILVSGPAGLSATSADRDSSGAAAAPRMLAPGDVLSSGVLSLPPVLAGAPLQLELEVPACQVGIVTVAASLSLQGDSAAATEAVKASVDTKMEAPFQLTHSISGPPHVHSLMLPASPAVQAPQPSGFSCVPCGLPCLLSVSLHSAARCQVRLMSVDLELPDPDEAQVIASCGGILPGHDGENGALLHKGSAYSTVFQLCPRKSSGQVRLGCIRLRWRRVEALSSMDTAEILERSRTGIGRLTDGLASVSLDDRANSDAGEKTDAVQRGLGLEVVTDLPLPLLFAEEAVVLASTEAPPQARAGTPFTYSVHLRNPGQILQDVTVSIGDTSGFVFSGERHGTTSVLPQQSACVSWTMVAYNAGMLTLPDVHLTSARYSTKMRVGTTSQIFVSPKEVTSDPSAQPVLQAVSN